MQMTTDTAVRVTRLVIQQKGQWGEWPLRPFAENLQVPLENIPYVDHPELRIDEHESIVMPFRYVIDTSKSLIMPEVSHRQT